MTQNGEKVFHTGDVIVREGDYGSAIYRIISGAAMVYANYEKRETEGLRQLAELHPGDCFGEMAVIEITQRSATVVASEDDTRVKEIDATDLSGYLSGHRGAICDIARGLSQRLRQTTEEYTEVCDTLRELGRLDQSGDRVNEGLLARIQKFARIHLAGMAADEPDSPDESFTNEGCDAELALRGEKYRAGSVIFREGDRSDCMYYIHAGRVGIYTGYGTKKQKLLTELTEEMFFGEMGLFEGLKRTATAVALENGTYMELIGENDLETIFEKNPALALMVLQHLSSRLRRLTKDYVKACEALAKAQTEIRDNDDTMTPELRARAEYLNQLLMSPEVLY